jgi:ssRNA-specific RNase YbeY (16S rRNA maturation enzyme)
MTNIQSSEKIEIMDDLDVKEIEQEQQGKNNNTDVTSGLDVFDLAELGSDLIDALGDLVSGISLDL